MNIKLCWDGYEAGIKSLVKQIKERKMTFDGIYGVPRGGLPIAVSISHQLKLPLLLFPTKNSLVVDDISDTGETLYFTKYKFLATLFTTDWTITKPHCWVYKKLNRNDWIVFPWEEYSQTNNNGGNQ